MPPGESDWSPVDFTLIRVADTGPHEPALAFGCQRINKDRPGFAGEIERRASIPVGSSIPCVDMRVAKVKEEFDESADRSEEHTSELQSLMRISSAVFCLKKKKQDT